jgi:polyhydroxybutyrate depolymerase
VERFGAKIGHFYREWLFQPGRAGAPVVVFLTGTGGTAAWADHETGWSKLAQREGFALAVPEALPPDPSAPPSFLTNPPRWNDYSPWGPDVSSSGHKSPFAAGIAADSARPDDVAFLDATIEHAVGQLGIGSSRVFVTGFSNGAGMAFRYAAERAARIDAVAPVAGHCWVPHPKPVRPVPTLYVIGTQDLLVPLRGGEVRLPWHHRLVRRPPVAETLERWATAIGCSPVPVLRRDDGAVRIDRYPGPVRFDAVTVEGLGHHWPGGRAQLNPRTAGPPSAAVNATEMVWEFFASA